jgi:hypothetical protein
MKPSIPSRSRNPESEPTMNAQIVTPETSRWIKSANDRTPESATKFLPLPGGDGERKCSPSKSSIVSPRQSSKRLAREWHTVETMVRLYCRDHHDASLCAECQGLLDYASLRLDRCRFGTEKPTCAKCPVHCYQKDRREQVRAIMRYAGPRMLWEHPLLSLRHWLDGLASRN